MKIQYLFEASASHAGQIFKASASRAGQLSSCQGCAHLTLAKFEVQWLGGGSLWLGWLVAARGGLWQLAAARRRVTEAHAWMGSLHVHYQMRQDPASSRCSLSVQVSSAHRERQLGVSATSCRSESIHAHAQATTELLRATTIHCRAATSRRAAASRRRATAEPPHRRRATEFGLREMRAARARGN